ncbi:transporter, partial [Salmonella enterica subsp. enterica serovar Kentucky]|nr:transporter [Salmonella enterica]ECI0179470.1 transporter [Salmonella enterica subsp. enterica serovar Kentucky]ECK7097705.1 transporter [Salmonella enterica subsp. enterica serovar Kentucky]ECS0850306.1 transporter [Salmonella enterica subsp. enterica serovar Kentucky]EDL0446070.1 transporter [Salmonella enterica subsp. enterica serovar Kentucky]
MFLWLPCLLLFFFFFLFLFFPFLSCLWLFR